MKNTNEKDYTFTFTDVTSITLTPDGKDGKAYIYCGDGSKGRMVTVASALVCDFDVSGAGGLDTGAEAASTGYFVYLIASVSDPATYPPALLFSVSSSSPTLPTGYTLRSDVIWFVANCDGGSNNDIYPFLHTGDYCFYDLITAGDGLGLQVLSSGAATSVTQITISYAVPSVASSYQANLRNQNTDANARNVEFYYDNGTTFCASALKIGALAGYDNSDHQSLILDPVKPLYYDWDAAPSYGSRVYIMSWKL